MVPYRNKKSRKLEEDQDAVYVFDTLEDAEDALVNWISEEVSEDAKLSLLCVRYNEGVINLQNGYELDVSENIPARDLIVLSRDVLEETSLLSYKMQI